MVVRINLMHKFSFPNASILNFEKLIERKVQSQTGKKLIDKLRAARISSRLILGRV
jgi:hypothetical protein